MGYPTSALMSLGVLASYSLILLPSATPSCPFCQLFLFPLLLLHQVSFLGIWAEKAVPACSCHPVWLKPLPALLSVGPEQGQARVTGAQ